jgi:hypothetical protein
MQSSRPRHTRTNQNEQHSSSDGSRPIPQATLQPLHDQIGKADQADLEEHPLTHAKPRKKKSPSSSQPETSTTSSDSLTPSSPPQEQATGTSSPALTPKRAAAKKR